MPNWAGQEKKSERLARWHVSPCKVDCFSAVEFRVTADGDHDWEGFACGEHLGDLVKYVTFRGRYSSVEWFGPSSAARRGGSMLGILDERLHDRALIDDELREYLTYFLSRLGDALNRAKDRDLTERTRAKHQRRADILVSEAYKLVFGKPETEGDA